MVIFMQEKSLVPSDQQQKFIELRAQGWTFVRIAQEIGVTKRTLITWSRKFQFEINNLRAIELEAIQANYVATREERIRVLGQRLQAIEDEIKKRDISQLPTPRLFSIAASLRREILKDTSIVKLTSPLNDIPGDEYSEQIHDWSA